MQKSKLFKIILSHSKSITVKHKTTIWNLIPVFLFQTFQLFEAEPLRLWLKELASFFTLSKELFRAFNCDAVLSENVINHVYAKCVDTRKLLKDNDVI